MKRFLFLHYGFEVPTAEIMADWNAWFDSLGDALLERSHFPEGVEVTAQGVASLPLAPDSITGYCIISASDLEAASHIAQRCPQIMATRVYPLQ